MLRSKKRPHQKEDGALILPHNAKRGALQRLSLQKSVALLRMIHNLDFIDCHSLCFCRRVDAPQRVGESLLCHFGDLLGVSSQTRLQQIAPRLPPFPPSTLSSVFLSFLPPPPSFPTPRICRRPFSGRRTERFTGQEVCEMFYGRANKNSFFSFKQPEKRV